MSIAIDTNYLHSCRSFPANVTTICVAGLPPQGRGSPTRLAQCVQVFFAEVVQFYFTGWVPVYKMRMEW